jgi:hypothetical protein
MAEADFAFSSEAQPLSNGRVIVRGTRIRTSSGGRDKKHVFIEVECPPEEAPAVQQALSIILQRHGRINASAF